MRKGEPDHKKFRQMGVLFFLLEIFGEYHKFKTKQELGKMEVIVLV